jgi:hypothetical protein
MGVRLLSVLSLLPAAALLAAGGGCSIEEGDPAADATSSASWSASRDSVFVGVEEMPELHGLSEEEVVTIMGPPDSETALTLHAGETLDEFHIEVHKTYRPDDPTIEGRIIRDLQWDRDGYREAVFLHEPVPGEGWIVLESVRWSDNVAF